VAKLPTDLSGREVRAALERAGFVFRRQTGSHMILRRDEPYARAVIPDHKQVRTGTLRRINRSQPKKALNSHLDGLPSHCTVEWVRFLHIYTLLRG